MKDIGLGRFEAFSAGVTPKGHVSPTTLKVLQEKFHIDASDARSKHWEEFKDHHLGALFVSREANSAAGRSRSVMSLWIREAPGQGAQLLPWNPRQVIPA